VTWKEKIDNKWRSRCLSVPPPKVAWVKNAIAQSYGIKEIQKFLAKNFIM